MPCGADLPLVAAETYLNRYKNGYLASSVASKQFYDDCIKRKGRLPNGAAPFLPQSELPVPVPYSRFPWPQVHSNLPPKQTVSRVKVICV